MGFCVLFVCMILLELLLGFTKCHSLNGAGLLLPVEATAATRGHYLALSKA